LSAGDRLRHAWDLLDVNRTDDAEEIVRAVLAEAPGDAAALCTLALCHNLGNEPEEMLAAATAAVAADPENGWAHRLRSAALRQLGRMPEAIAAADAAVALDPQSRLAAVARTNALLGAGLAIEAYWAALRVRYLAPDDPDTFYLMAEVYEAVGELAAARHEYTEGLRMKPDSVLLLAGLGRLDYLQGRYRRAARRFAAALGLRPTLGYYRRWLDLALRKIRQRLGMAGVGAAGGLLFLYLFGAAAWLRAVVAVVLLAGYLALLGWLHRGLPRVWRIRWGFGRQPAGPLWPPPGLLTPVALIAVLGVAAGPAVLCMLTVWFVAELALRGSTLQSMDADISASWRQFRQREEFRRGWTQ